jgi:hypothetical protein
MYWIINLYNRVRESSTECKFSSVSGYFPSRSSTNTISKESVWKVPFKQTFFELLEVSHAKLTCEDFFVVCYWLCMIYTLTELVLSINEFIRVYSNQNYTPASFWNRKYDRFSKEKQRFARILGTVINITSTCSQIYGYTHFRYRNLVPRIFLNVIVLSFELLYWIINGLASKSFKIKPMISILALFIRIAVAAHVMVVIKRSQI